MVCKKIIALALCFLTVVSLASCKEDNGDDFQKESTSVYKQEEEIPQIVTDEAETTGSAGEDNTLIQSETSTSVLADDPAMWNVAQTVDFYKNAAVKTNAGAKSLRSISLTGISINNGQYAGVMDFVSSIMNKIISKNSTEVDGITGGFASLSETDVKTAKAYKSGSSTVIEMTMIEQTDGAKDDMNGGTVGHAMSVVGDISVVVEQLKEYGLPIELSENDTKIYYTDPVLKVVIDENGKIVNGTWSYTVDINMNNYKVFGTSVNSTSVVMQNVITLNGGFSK